MPKNTSAVIVLRMDCCVAAQLFPSHLNRSILGLGQRFSVPRPVSWLPRLAEIRRSVKNSVRSHYERKDIERLFQLQPRSAQALIQGIAPSAKVGQGYLLARADLQAFLERVAEGNGASFKKACRSARARR